jgi:Zn-dependent peptidase ImmA (M78 family)/DNA-binding XRE family transcriptional regulator
MRSVAVPITPSVLAWAIEESGYSADEIAARLDISPETVKSWLRGRDQPGLTKFRRLAAVLKRTPSTLLLPSPPQRHYPRVKFRRATGEARTQLNPVERRYIREAARLQRILSWVLEELGRKTVSLPRAEVRSDTEGVARRIRDDLGVTEAIQIGWKSSSTALDAWRSALEDKGILVFLLPLGASSCRGFSLGDARAPVVAVNTYWNTEARIFSMFHELGHLVTGTDSACLEVGLAGGMAEPGDDVERWCERLSAAVLMPAPALRNFIRAMHVTRMDLSVAAALAKRFKVSLRAAAIRLIQEQMASWDLYRQIPPASDKKPEGGGGTGRRRLQLREDQFGKRATRLFVEAVDKDVLSRSDVLGVLNIGDADFERLEFGDSRS